MISLASILPLLTRQVWFASIDLTDAYFHIAIRKTSRRFLSFIIGNRPYSFQVLPFGLATAPRVFTKCIATVCAHLRQKGIQVFPYTDDWLLTADSKDELQDHIRYTLQLLHDLGLVVNYKKSNLFPLRRIQFIGAVLGAEK